MKHPSDAELALYAGGDLGWLRQKLSDRHVRNCGACQAAVVEFSELRSEADQFPAIEWKRLSGEMAANIRLGLEAGECVHLRSARGSFFARILRTDGARPRLAVALAGLIAVAGAGFLLQRSIPALTALPAVAGTLLESSENGLLMREGSRSLRLLNTSGSAVSRSVGPQGELGARYLDPNTGNVTVTQVYGE